MCERINLHLKNKDIICEKQSGFSPGHSTGTALLYRKNLPIMNTLCDWLSDTMMISVCDSFFRTVISIVFIVLYCPDHLSREAVYIVRWRPFVFVCCANGHHWRRQGY